MWPKRSEGTEREYICAIKGALIFLLIPMLAAGFLPTISVAKPVSTETHFQAIIPATIDPTANLPSVADAYVSDRDPKRNYGASTGMYAGYDLDTGTYRSFVRFDLSGIPSGATINSASFNAYTNVVSATPYIGLYPIHSSWGEGMVTWSNQPDVDEYATVAKVVSQADEGKWVSWNLTWLVGVWAAGSDNYGVCLQAPKGGWAEFCTRETKTKVPYLLVDYTSEVPPVDTTPPQVSITHSPGSPTTEDQVTFTATGSDLGSGIQKIEILVNASLAKTCTSSPCIYTGGPYPAGTVTYGANAYDKAGNRAWTGYLSFTVGPAPDITPPGVSITYSPGSPTTADQVTFAAVASDPSGIQKIEIMVNASLVKTCTSSPCTYTGGPYPAGTVTYAANAYDKAGNTALTGYLSFTVGPAPDTTPPGVSITYSPEGPTTQDQVTFTAAASDASGIQKIEILVNASLVKTCTSSPCTYTGGPYPAGTVTYGANAYDKAGNTAWTGYLSFTVGQAASVTSPKVSFSPASQKVRPGDSFTVDIYVETAGRGISGASVEMGFDAAAVQVGKVELGNLLGASPTLATGSPEIDNVGGLLRVDATRTAATPVPTAPGVFARVKLIVKTEATTGTYNLNLEVKVADENRLNIPGVVIEEGTITVFQATYSRWDINEDGKVDIKDLAILGAHYGDSAQPPYPRHDINEDGTVDSQDLAILGAHYGEGTGH